MDHKLNTKEYITKIQEAVRSAATFNDRAGAFELLRAIQEVLKQSELPGEVRSLWEEAQRDAVFGALSVLPDREVLQAIEQHLLYYLDQENYDIVHALKGKLAGFDIVEDRDAFRARLREAFMNSQGLMSAALELTDDAKQEGTARNWISHYLQTTGTPAPDPLKRAEFMTSRAVTRSTAQEQVRLKRLLEVFDYLRFSSLSGEGFEEDLVADFDDRLMILQEGKVLQVDPKTDEMMAKIMPAMMAALKRVWAIQAAEPTELEKKAQARAAGLDLAIAVKSLEEILAGGGSKDQETGLAALYAGFKGGVGVLLQKMRGPLETLLKSGPEAERRFSILAADPASAGVLKLLLKEILARLGFSEAHGAALAGRMLSILSAVERERYLKIAYYDFERGEFVWGEV